VCPSYFRFPMVFKCSLVNKNLFAANYNRVRLLMEHPGKQTVKLGIERDKNFDKCKHAIKVLLEVSQEAADNEESKT